MDKAKFFAAIRRELFDGALTPQQVYRIEVLLDAIIAADWPLSYASYALATSFHESFQFKHMKELGGEGYFKRMYDKAGARPKVAATLGNTEAGDGVKFAGRGYVQCTGRANYQKAGKALGIDLLKEPQMAEEPAIAARMLIWGMSTGAYTGKANRDYLAKSPPDYVNARRIINGTDKASLIATYAKEFQAALVGAGYGKAAPVPAAKPEPVPAPLPVLPSNRPAGMPADFQGNQWPTRNDGQFTAPKSERSWWSSVVNKLLGREP